MYASDNADTLPGVSSSVSWATSSPATQKVDDRVFDCPSQKETGSVNAPEYGYNALVARMTLGDFTSPASCPLIADLRMEGHAPNYTIQNWERDIDARHLNGVVVGYVDGHVSWMKGPEKGGSMLLALLQQGCDPFQGGTAVTGFRRAGSVGGNAGMRLLPTRSTVQPGAHGYAFSADIMLSDIASVKTCGISAWDGGAQVWIDPAAQQLYGITPRADGTVKPASTPIKEAIEPQVWYTLKGIVTHGWLTVVLYKRGAVLASFQSRSYAAHGTRPGLIATGTSPQPGRMAYREFKVFTW